MKWIDIKEQKPTLEDCGKEFLIKVKTPSGFEHQVCEWYNPELKHKEPFFDFENKTYGQLSFEKEIMYWILIK